MGVDVRDGAAQEVLRQRVRLLYDHLPFVLSGNLVTATGLTAMLWSRSSHALLLAWLAAVVANSAVRFLVRLLFRARGPGFRPRPWAAVATFFSGLSGVLWGAAGLLLFQPDLVTTLALAVVIAGMTAGSVMAHSCWLPAYVAYAVPTVMPFSLRCLVESGDFHTTLGVLSLMFLLVNVYYGRNIQRSLVESLRLRFENLALVAELRRQKERAEDASAAKSRFLAAASHDLRQPVQAMELFMDALEHDLRDSPSLPLLQRMREAGRGLESLLGALLDVSRMDAAAIRPEPRDFPLAPLFERLLAGFVPQAAACGLTLRVVPTRAWVHSDPALVERILRNFVANALKYTDRGGVVVGCRRAGDCLRIEVHDSGIGIPPEAQREVFREFHQLANPERDRAKGLGLGLAIAEGLARLLDHPLGLRSQPGKGSSFSITLPRASAAQVAPAPAAAALPDHVAGRTVLLIDDDAAIRTAATELLERWDCAAVTAESAVEAIDLMEASGFVPDAVITDYRLRDGTTGVAAIKAVQAHCGEVPAALLTGDTAPDRLLEAQASGYPLVHKPLTAGKLRALLSTLLATHGEPASSVREPE